MRTKNVVYFLSFLLIASAFTYCAGAAQTNTVSFHGAGVTVDLSFPEEAHPSNSTTYNETITHDVVISSDSPTVLQSFTMVVKAVVNQSLEVIYSGQDTFPKPLNPLNQTYSLTIPLPLGTNGSLQCSINVRTTSMGSDDLHFTVQTTQVRTLTYTELLFAHNQLLADYTLLNNSYVALNNTYNALRTSYLALNDSYNALFADYETLNASYSTLWTEYLVLNDTYNGLAFDYGTLDSAFNSLSTAYANLNSTFNSLIAQNSALQSQYNSLNSTYYSLQANYSSLEAGYNGALARNTGLQSDYSLLSSEHSALAES